MELRTKADRIYIMMDRKAKIAHWLKLENPPILFITECTPIKQEILGLFS